MTGATAFRTAARRSTVGALDLEVTTGGGGTITDECDTTTSGLEATWVVTAVVDPDPWFCCSATAVATSLVSVGAGSWVSVVAAMVIGPVELVGSSWPEIPSEAVAPVSGVLPAGAVTELTTFFWFESSAIWVSAVESPESESATAIAPPKLPTRRAADMQIPSA